MKDLSKYYGLDKTKITFWGPLILLLLQFACLSPEFGRTDKNEIRVMSYNIHYGRGKDGEFNLNRIAKVINEAQPDIVGLQEIGDSIMAADLGRLTGMNYVFGPSLGKANGYGDAILSKHPITSVNHYSIPSASSSRYQVMGVNVDLSTIYGPHTAIRFINTHFDWLRTIGSQEARLASVEVIERGFFKNDKKLISILTGDLNAEPESEPLKKLKSKGWITDNAGKELTTIGFNKSGKQIDFVMVRPRRNWKILNAEVLNEPLASDHLPVVLTLKLIQ